MNEVTTVASFDPGLVKEPVNQWIISQFADTLGDVEKALDDYRFNDAANRMYQFVLNSYCDWYLELTKPIFVGLDEDTKKETRATVAYVRDEILKSLHPFMPFITEELWQITAPQGREKLLALTQWPNEQPYFVEAHEEIGWLIELVNTVRSVRAEMNVPASTLIQLELVNPADITRQRAERWDASLNRLARISGTVFRDKASEGSVQLLVGGEIAALPLKGVIDLAAERARLEKEIGKADADIKRVDAKLGNEKFVANAPEEIVEEEKEKREAAMARKAKLQEALQRLKMAS
jgi:valyl-tRNA synthetase